MTTADYVCKHCGASGVKLWRRYQTLADHTKLLCATCAEKDQGEPRKAYGRGEGDQIGWHVPAVPDGDGSYWGYSSVPEDRVAWWHSLLERPEQQESCSEH